MARTIAIISNDYISQDEIFSFTRSLDGSISELRNYLQGVICKGEATVWIYYRGDDFNLDDEELEILQKKHNILPKVAIALDISSSEGSKELAIDFCSKLIQQYPNIIIDDSYGNFLLPSELNKL